MISNLIIITEKILCRTIKAPIKADTVVYKSGLGNPIYNLIKEWLAEKLLTQIHTLLFIHLSEEWIKEIFNKANGFTR